MFPIFLLRLTSCRNYIVYTFLGLFAQRFYFHSSLLSYPTAMLFACFSPRAFALRMAIFMVSLFAASFATLAQTTTAINVQPDTTAAKKLTIPGSITRERIMPLFDKVIGAEMNFTGQAFTVSLENENAKGALQYISTAPATLVAGATRSGKVFYTTLDGIGLEADLYFTGVEKPYFAFLEQGKVFAANYITPDGVAFFGRVVGARVEAVPNK